MCQWESVLKVAEHVLHFGACLASVAAASSEIYLGGLTTFSAYLPACPQDLLHSGADLER